MPSRVSSSGTCGVGTTTEAVPATCRLDAQKTAAQRGDQCRGPDVVSGPGGNGFGPTVDRGESRWGVEVIGECGADLGDDGLGRGAALGGCCIRPAEQPVFARHQVTLGPVPITAVVVREERESERHWVMAVIAQPRDEDQVALRLRHLLATKPDHSGVDEV